MPFGSPASAFPRATFQAAEHVVQLVLGDRQRRHDADAVLRGQEQQTFADGVEADPLRHVEVGRLRAAVGDNVEILVHAKAPDVADEFEALL